MITAFVLGIAFGLIAGLVPGVHINLISSLVLAGSGFILDYFAAKELAVFIVAMGITHAFVEVVPSIFLGAPDDTTALVMLPGHKMLHEGLGYDAVLRRDYPTIMGLTILTAAFVMVVNLIVDVVYSLVDPRIVYSKKE